MRIYLAVGRDRNVDDWYSAFAKLEDAIKWCKNEEAAYDGRYEFEEEPADDEWLYHSEAGDDCPKFHVEVIDLDLAPVSEP